MAIIESEVISLLANNYDSNISLVVPMAAAQSLLTRIIACAVKKGNPLTDEEIAVLGQYLAAHFYQITDPGFQSKSTVSASGSFRGQTTKGMEATLFGQAALNLDPSGCLAVLTTRMVAGAQWLGRNNQTPFVRRT